VSKPLLEVADVEAGYGEALVLRGVSLTAFEAELVAIIGPNGAGKSTLLKVIYGLLRPTSGHVRYRTDDVTGVRPERLTRLLLGLTLALAWLLLAAPAAAFGAAWAAHIGIRGRLSWLTRVLAWLDAHPHPSWPSAPAMPSP